MRQEDETLFVLKWLVDQGFLASAMSLEEESGVSLHGYSGKIGLLKELCFKGDFIKLREFLSEVLPAGCETIRLILVQELKEDLFNVSSRSEMSDFVDKLTRYRDVLPGALYWSFVDAATMGVPRNHKLFYGWNGVAARYELFGRILTVLEPIFPDCIAPTALKSLSKNFLSVALHEYSEKYDLEALTRPIKQSANTKPGIIPEAKKSKFELKNTFTESTSSNPIRAIAFSNSSRYLAVGTNTHSLVICEVPTLEAVGKSKKSHAGSVFTCAWSPDDRLIATGSNDQLIRITPVSRLIEGEDSEQGFRLQLDLGTIRCLNFMAASGPNSIVVGFSSDCITRIIDFSSGAVVTRLNPNITGAYVNSIGVCGGLVAAGLSSGEVCLFDSRTQPDRACIWSCISNPEGLPAVVDVSILGHHVGIGDGTGKVALWDIRQPSCADALWSKKDMHADSVRSVKFDTGCNWLASASFDKMVKLVDLGQNNYSDIVELAGHDDRVVGLAWSSDGHLASCGTDAKVIIWS
jgi:hypothetical protein